MAKSKVTVEDVIEVACSNCANTAFYSYNVTSSFAIPYCQYHLPRFLLNSDLVTQVIEASSVEEVVEEVAEESNASNP